jgi:hypothetical protein
MLVAGLRSVTWFARFRKPTCPLRLESRSADIHLKTDIKVYSVAGSSFGTDFGSTCRYEGAKGDRMLFSNKEIV